MTVQRKLKLFYTVLALTGLIVYFPMFAGTAHAQAISLPETATELIPWLIAVLTGTGFSAWIGTSLTDGLKNLTKKFPIITPADVPLISGLGSKLLVAILVAVAGQLGAYFLPYAQYLDQTGLWTVIVAGVIAAQKLYLEERSVKGDMLTSIEVTGEVEDFNG